MTAPLPSSAAWIWCSPDGAGRNVFARFRRSIHLARVPTHAPLHLFADARWRLRINGVVAGYGPGRFHPAFPIFDTVELSPWLRAGDNLIEVEAWSPGCSTYQTAPESSGGFIAWGGCAGHDLATPGGWQTLGSTAWDAEAPAYSFAQGPVEILDLRRLATEDGWSAPCVRRDGPWGGLAPRPLPPLGLAIGQAPRVLLAAALAGDEQRHSLRRLRQSGLAGKQRFAYAMAIESPRDQEVELGLFWGPHWINGAPLAMQRDALRGNRENARATLRAGRNLLYGEPEVLTAVWAQYVALPRAAGLTVASFAASEAMTESDLAERRGAVPSDEALLARCCFILRSDAISGGAGAIPARDMAWDLPGRALGDLQLPLRCAAEGCVVVLDHGREFLGHARLVIEGEAGTVVDLVCEERLRPDGLIALYSSNPFTDCADRVVLAGGRQEVELFHPHGGRYQQLAIRGPATLHAVELRDHQVPVARTGEFRCADPTFTWIWEAAHATVQACVEDAFVDCPWRERGTYLGDALVEDACLAAFDADRSVSKRTIELFAQGQRADGMLPGCSPSWLTKVLPDFTLLWVQVVHQWWAREGVSPFVAEMHQHALRVLDSAWWRRRADGLVDVQDGAWCFIDWGARREDTQGEANACINILFVRALTCAAEVAQALGRGEESATLAARATAMRAAVRRSLWLPAQNRFAARLLGGRPEAEGGALHANVLAAACGIPDAAQESGTMAAVRAGLARNRATALDGDATGYLELYFLAYALPALYARGEHALAEMVMREHWGVMRERGAWTIWECLRRGHRGTGSLCHAWSTAPVRWLQERVLGVRRASDGDPDRLIVDPCTTLDWAEGVVPHARGPIRVAWRRSADGLAVEVQAPPGVEVRVAPR